MSGVPLRFLADESCDQALVRALRDRGLDVVAVSEISPRSSDREVLDQAHREARVLLTEDKDFGWLVHVSRSASSGVILLRFPGNARASLVATALQVVEGTPEQVRGAFIVLQPGQVRFDRSRLKSDLGPA